MKSHPAWLLWIVCATAAALASSTSAQSAFGRASIVGIDHVSVAVSDLEQASTVYRQLGFTLKGGRVHANGIRNNHVKFPDGSGLELISVSEPNDALAARYVDFIRDGEGPAYVSFHARDTSQLLRALQTANIAYSQDQDLITLHEPALRSVFFVRDNRAPSDRPEHFVHPNSARAMTAVWLAPDDALPLSRLFAALGAAQSSKTVFVPEPIEATVFEVTNGRVVLLPKARQLLEGRSVVGVTFQLARLDSIVSRLSSEPSLISAAPSAGTSSRFVPPVATHGMWLEFRAAP